MDYSLFFLTGWEMPHLCFCLDHFFKMLCLSYSTAKLLQIPVAGRDLNRKRHKATLHLNPNLYFKSLFLF